jgi:hypothetical protein
VISDLNPDGATEYLVSVVINDDDVLPLTGESAMSYAAAVTRAATIAQHDAAVIKLLGRLGVSTAVAATMIVDLRDGREPLDPSTTYPLRYEPIVSATSFAPFVHVWLRDKRISQWTPEDCFQHAGHVMQSMTGVDLDTAFYRYLTEKIDLDPPTARAAVSGLGDERTGLADDERREKP